MKKIIKPKLSKKTHKKPKPRVLGDITDQKTFEIAERFNSYKRKTAENIIEMGRVVVEAKKRTRSEFEDFCLLIGYDWASSTLRKLESIGNKYEYLITKCENLPANWTVIYEISRLDSDVIEGYIQDYSITSQSTGASIDKLLVNQNLKTNKPSNTKNISKNVPNRTNSDLEFVAFIDKIDSEKQLVEISLLIEKLKKVGVQISCSKALETSLTQLNTLEMAA